MKIKLLLIPAFILGSILYVNAQATPQKLEDAVNLEALPAEGPAAETPTPKANTGGSSGEIKIQSKDAIAAPDKKTSEPIVNKAINNSNKNKPTASKKVITTK